MPHPLHMFYGNLVQLGKRSVFVVIPFKEWYQFWPNDLKYRFTSLPSCIAVLLQYKLYDWSLCNSFEKKKLTVYMPTFAIILYLQDHKWGVKWEYYSICTLHTFFTKWTMALLLYYTTTITYVIWRRLKGRCVGITVWKGWSLVGVGRAH